MDSWKKRPNQQILHVLVLGFPGKGNSCEISYKNTTAMKSKPI